MAGVQAVRLNELNINIKHALIVGIIIAKSSPRIINSKKKSGEKRGVTSFTIRDSEIDTINADVWGSEYFIMNFYERFLVGDVVTAIFACKSLFIRLFLRQSALEQRVGVCSNPSLIRLEAYAQQWASRLPMKAKWMSDNMLASKVTSPFSLCINEGNSDVISHNEDSYSSYLPLLHIPTKPSSGYYGLAEVLKLPEDGDVYVDLLVVVKSVKPAKKITTRAGQDMMVRSVEITDNTTPVSLQFDIYDTDTIQRAEEWRPLESVIFIADARVRQRRIQLCGKSVLTHQPHTADAEALRLHIKAQAESRGGSAKAWGAWSGGACAASVAQVRERALAGMPLSADLNALLSYINLEDLMHPIDPLSEDLLVRFSDHTGEMSARMPFNVIEDTFGYTVQQIKTMSTDDRNGLRWRFLLEQCIVKLASSAPPRFMVLALRRARTADPIPLY